MPLPDSVAKLVERFEANRKEYHQAHYNETQTRVDFVNPLFEALGWDMDNRQGLSEVQREVIHEDALKIGGTTKAPDYGFRVGGQRRFFLETKKPSVNLKLLAAPAYQLRRYAWTAKLPVSLLTNFGEFAVYDGRVIPDHKDGPMVARLDYFKYADLPDRWDEIAARFSHDAVLSGAFDRYAAEAPGRKSFIPVDAAFLARISEWRETLARNVVANNPGGTPRELNYAVQMIIDRIIFLRISEDRGVETQYRLEPLQNGTRVYPRLLEVFRHADARYNSGLFHFEKEKGRGQPDDVTPRLAIDDRPLRDILGGLYGEKNPYVFSIFPADILGQVYEQFLGKVIRISGKTAEVEEKPEVKKAGGVYYTPTYIVNYIVQNTVGKLVEGKTPAQVARLTILDPTCGSGSFLLGAYQFLLDWHLKYYTDHDPAKRAKGKNAVLYLAAKDAAGRDVWRLTTAEKKRILLANVYGVDIDTQAVEVTKLSLLLKVLEGESGEVLNNTLKLYQERVLPDLENNVQCGNSLIGPDFYDDKKPEDFDLDARLKINAFDWKSAFPKIMADGGFDAVIGNPPYSNYSARDSMRAFYERNGMNEDLRLLTQSLEYCSKNFESVSRGCRDLYKWFMYHGLRLSKPSGTLGFIVPNTWLTLPKYADLKNDVLTVANDVRILDLGFGVFSVTVPTCLALCSKNSTIGRKEHTDLKDVPQKQAALQNVIWSNFTSTQFKSDPLVEKYFVSWPQDSRLNSGLTLREGQHIPRLWLTEGTNPGAVPIIDSKNMGRYQFNWMPQFTFSAADHPSVQFTTTSERRVVIRKTGDRIVATLTPATPSYVLQKLLNPRGLPRRSQGQAGRTNPLLHWQTRRARLTQESWTERPIPEPCGAGAAKRHRLSPRGLRVRQKPRGLPRRSFTAFINRSPSNTELIPVSC